MADYASMEEAVGKIDWGIEFRYGYTRTQLDRIAVRLWPHLYGSVSNDPTTVALIIREELLAAFCAGQDEMGA